MRTLFPLALLTLFSIGCGGEPGKFNTVGQAIGEASPKDAGEVGGRVAGDGDKASRLALAEAVTGTDTRPRRQTSTTPGVLTAGSFDDNLEPRAWRAFLKRLGQDPGLGAHRFLGQPLIVTVTGSDGGPIGNARVRLESAGQDVLTLTTRSDGRAVFLAAAAGTITVFPPDGSASLSQTVPRGAARADITLPSATSSLPQHLDLALVLDTTGSMGDELEFLKNEIQNIVATVRKKFPRVDPQFSLVVYRDDGDEYVTRSFEFTPSLEQFRRNLAVQQAGGGGDEPEALHRALEDAQQLRWRDAHTARVLFLITDAPPHRAHLERSFRAVDSLRQKGVAIYPIACSGYNNDAEFVLRACALMTGSQFLFLTNDSGVGAAHAEPHIPSYHVQKLERLMIRMIASELSGTRLEPDHGDILRTVGQPIH